MSLLKSRLEILSHVHHVCKIGLYRVNKITIITIKDTLARSYKFEMARQDTLPHLNPRFFTFSNIPSYPDTKSFKIYHI